MDFVNNNEAVCAHLKALHILKSKFKKCVNEFTNIFNDVKVKC